MRGTIAKSLTALASSAIVAFVGIGAHATVTVEHKATADQRSNSTASARNIIADSRKIVTPEGIESLTAVPINGIKQFISVRGRDRRNPILLFLHGGPGSPDLPLAYEFQAPWEDYFTVVQWDQRGTGKTYAINDPKQVAPTITISQMEDDAAQLTQYLRTTYHKQKIFVLGHSWGSVLGLMLAQRHPDWLYAYIGVGQVINMRDSEAAIYKFALTVAAARHDRKALEDLHSLEPYPGSADLTVKRLALLRKYTAQYGGLAYGRTSFAFDANAWTLSPDYSDHDLDSIGAGSRLTLDRLLHKLTLLDLSGVTKLGCPIFLFSGRHDETVSQDVAARWFATLDAPQKRLVWFDQSAHMVMQEQPGRFLVHLVQDVRPIAVRAGDAAPDETVQ